ncbi:hypothetical protein [Streptomyces sp. ME19-01-6]|uniref:hypothetical protein n=1 Tax=Streptomyces sp. ME19-01-6 TaxID=3028686 RepID=UPI0029A04B6D|nr:hypothetical protein [Streptomyces sp. ME19-01-6]MDX3232539.1 hypothetical protein [Streptomyces sp. ME19-01-6]
MFNTTRLSDGLPILEEAMQHLEVQALPPGQHETAARSLVARQRREQLTDRRTWDAGDPAPTKNEWVRAVLDQSGALWRSIPGSDVWREVPRMDPGRTPGAPLETFVWSELLEELGPVTEPPAAWSRQRGEVVEVLRGAVVELDDLLFHTVGAYMVGTEIPDGRMGEHEDDDDLLDHATMWADRLENAVEKLRAAASAATLLHDEVVTDLTQALACVGLGDSHAKRGPNGEVSVHLSPENANRLGGRLGISTDVLPMSLRDVGVKTVGGYSAAHSTTVHLTDDGGRLLVKLLHRVPSDGSEPEQLAP